MTLKPKTIICDGLCFKIIYGEIFPKHLVQEAQVTDINQLQIIPHDAKPLKLCGMLLKTYYTYNNLRDYSVLSFYKFLQMLKMSYEYVHMKWF
jgi:hypothetical protein